MAKYQQRSFTENGILNTFFDGPIVSREDLEWIAYDADFYLDDSLPGVIKIGEVVTRRSWGKDLYKETWVKIT